MSATPTSSGCASGFLLVWLALWTLCVGVFDCVLVYRLCQQGRSLTFDSAPGVVTRSHAYTPRDSEGDAQRLAVAYEYEVNGRKYTGTRYGRGEEGVTLSAWPDGRAGLPVGEPVRVYFDPDDPSDSFLRPGLTGSDLALLWFLTPFNVIMLGGLALFATRNRPAFDPADPRTVTPTDFGWVVKLPTLSPPAVFGVLLLAITFAGTFLWGFKFGGNPPVWLAGWCYVAAVVLSARIAWFRPYPLLEVDALSGVVRLNAQTDEEVAVPFAAILGFAVRHEASRDSDGDSQNKYHCELLRRDASATLLATHDTPEAAGAFVNWLREVTGAR